MAGLDRAGIRAGEGLECWRVSEAKTIYVVDSYRRALQRASRSLMRKYLKCCQPREKMWDGHAHNNLQFGLRQHIEAIVLGANYARRPMAGLGRALGMPDGAADRVFCTIPSIT